MPARKRLRAAVVGTGMIARKHWSAYLAHAADVEVVAAMDIDEARLGDFCALGGDVRPYHDLDALLAEQKPDLVSICTPPGLHVEQAKAVLRSGAWAWCEKPPCLSLAEFDEIAAAEPESGPYAAFVFQQRFGSAAEHFRTLLASGELGRPLVAHCQTTWYRDAGYYAVPWRGKWGTEGGGPAMGHGIHQMDLLLHLLGDWAEVRAMAGRLVHDVETEDVSTALVRFSSGALATVVNSVLSPDEVSRIRIDCEHATVELTHLYGYGVKDWTYTPAPHIAEERVAHWRNPGLDVESSHNAAFAEFLAAYRAGRRPPCSGPDVRRTLELVAALYKAAFTGCAVRAGEITPDDPFRRAMHGGLARGPGGRGGTSMSAPITVTHRHGERVAVEAAGVQLMSYVYKPDPVAYESRKPYAHPLRTLGGRQVSAYRPADHRWHKGLQMTSSHLSGQNFWGGHTYVPGDWYRDLPDRIGSMRHDGFDEFYVEDARLVMTERLTWVANGGEEWARERRDVVVHSVEPDEGAWAIDWSIRLTNIRDQPLEFGSPTTAGRDMAGYTGLHWRGPRDFSGGQVFGPGDVSGDEMMGKQAPWLAFVGEHDAVDAHSTLVFAHAPENAGAIHESHWFVRTKETPAVAISWAFFEEFTLPPGESFAYRYRVVVADGAWDRDRVAGYLAAHGF